MILTKTEIPLFCEVLDLRDTWAVHNLKFSKNAVFLFSALTKKNHDIGGIFCPRTLVFLEALNFTP
jgi:hypothetical protein